MRLLLDPRLREILLSLAILLGSYLAARLLSFLFAQVLTRAARRTASSLDDRLIGALKRPLTYSLFLVGVWAAVHRLPVARRWIDRSDGVLFVLAALLVTLGVARAYGIFLSWYTTESRHPTAEGLAKEFGPLFGKVGKVFIAVVGVITILQHFGVNVASLVVSLGVGSLAVGLAAQDTLANMFAGFTLMLDRPFKVGDRVRLATGEVGDVQAIGIRATHIRTLDETILVVPNSALVKERLTNLTWPDRHLTVRLELSVPHDSDFSLVRKILTDSALASPHVDLSRPPVALVARFGEFAVVWLLVFWARDYTEEGLARSEVHEEIHRRLGEAGIEFPVPVRRVISGSEVQPS